MPELPEVETVKNQLSELLGDEAKINRFEFFRKDLRHQLPIKKLNQLVGQKIISVERRAKYLLFKVENGAIIISHLGMSGSWRRKNENEQKRNHDHIYIHFKNGLTLAYSDPRRFGIFDLEENIKPSKTKKSQKSTKSKWLVHLGVEPLSSEFDEDYLYAKTRGKKTPIKNLLMDQKIVVGVGNIYASEALFLAGIKPHRQSAKLKKEETPILLSAIQQVLKKAIEKGGSTIRDYKSLSEASGGYQAEHNVYGREKESCHKCSTLIKSKVFAGRSTFWCPSCQK